MNKNKKCEYCEIGGCGGVECPVHGVDAVPSQPTPEKVWLDRVMNQIIENQKNTINPIFQSEDTQPTGEWEVEFDSLRFGAVGLGYEVYDRDGKYVDLKDFIRSLLLSSHEKVIKEIEDCLSEYKCGEHKNLFKLLARLKSNLK